MDKAQLNHIFEFSIFPKILDEDDSVPEILPANIEPEIVTAETFAK